MNILAIDTSTSLASIAIVSGTRIQAETSFICDRTLSARLMPEIEHQLSLAGLGFDDIDLFAASTGPGSFTGVRCGIATVQGLAMATGKPCAGFSSLAMLALNIPCSHLPVCPLLDARKNEVYAGMYDTIRQFPAERIPDCVAPLDAFLDQASTVAKGQIIFLGDGALRYHDAIAARMGERALMAPSASHSPRASHGAMLALQTHLTAPLSLPSQLLPNYIRPSEAELARLAATQ